VSSLAEVQIRLRHWITAPEGVETALASEPGGARAVVRGDARLSAEDRLSVYANAYFERLCGCLENDYPTLRWTLGEAWFRDLVTSYLLAHPPTHPSLRWAGQHLATFVAEDSRGEPFRRGRGWVGDLARFEWALADAFDAADTPALERSALAALDPDRFAGLRFAVHPSLRLLALEWPIQKLRRAWRKAGDGERCEPAPEELAVVPEAVHAVIWRADERVFHRSMDRSAFEALQRTARGEPFGTLCERIAEDLGDAAAPARAASWLGEWIDAGWIQAPVE